MVMIIQMEILEGQQSLENCAAGQGVLASIHWMSDKIQDKLLRRTLSERLPCMPCDGRSGSWKHPYAKDDKFKDERM